MVYLYNFLKTRPDQVTLQSELHQQMLHDFSERYRDDSSLLKFMTKLADKYACKSEYIETRGHEVPNYKSSLFETDPKSSRLERKVKFYAEKSFEKLQRLFEKENKAPSVLTHVTCTGYSSPSATQKLISQSNWSETTNFHAYHMGCYAAFPAIRMSSAELFRRREFGQSYERADVFHSELSSLHFDRDRLDPEQMVVQTLFADGYIKYSLSLEPPTQNCFRVHAIHEEVIPESQSMMTWDISEPGFQMTLSRHLPQIIKKYLAGFIDRIDQKTKTKLPQQSLLFAIHPGGPKIINEIQDLLHLSSDQVKHCRNVLKNFGNMSSATLPTVWDSMLNDPLVPDGQKVLSFAFGPGLTICGALLEKVSDDSK